MIFEPNTNFHLTGVHRAQWFPHSLVGPLTSGVFSFTGSENHSGSEITVNEIHLADYNTHPLLGCPVLLSPFIVTPTLKGM